MALPRFLLRNILATTPGVVFTPSTQLASMPATNVVTPGLGTRWRTASGWTFTVANCTLRFNRGGVKTATVALGTYATGALTAAAWQAALTAADGAVSWSVTYSSGRFTISANVAFVLEFGTLVANSAHVDLGFASSTSTSVTSVPALNQSYQSRHTLHVDLGANISHTATMMSGHNVSASGTVLFQSDELVSLVNVGLGDITTPDVNEPLETWFADPFGLSIPGTPPKRYMRLIISDVGNAAGFAELAVWWVGSVSYLSVLPSVQYGKDNEHLSEIVYAEGGAQMRVPRARRRVYRLLFQLEQRNGLAVSDRILFDAIDALGIGTNFFATFDLPGGARMFVYGFLREGISETYTVGTYWGLVLNIAEAIQVALLTGLVSYWRLTEAGGVRLDAIGTNHLTDNNTVTSGAGKIGPTVAAQFAAASSESLSCVDNPSLSMGVGVSWTIALWVFPTTRTTLQGLVSKDDAAAQREYLIFLAAGSGDLFVLAVQPPGQSATYPALPLNAWSFVVGWFSIADLKMHLQVNNGTVADSAGTLTHTFDGTAPFLLGTRNAGEFFTGRMQHVALWKRVLTSDERTALWNGGLGLDLAFFTPPPALAPVTGVPAAAIGHGQLGLASGLRTFPDLVGGAE